MATVSQFESSIPAQLAPKRKYEGGMALVMVGGGVATFLFSLHGADL